MTHMVGWRALTALSFPCVITVLVSRAIGAIDPPPPLPPPLTTDMLLLIGGLGIVAALGIAFYIITKSHEAAGRTTRLSSMPLAHGPGEASRTAPQVRVTDEELGPRLSREQPDVASLVDFLVLAKAEGLASVLGDVESAVGAGGGGADFLIRYARELALDIEELIRIRRELAAGLITADELYAKLKNKYGWEMRRAERELKELLEGKKPRVLDVIRHRPVMALVLEVGREAT